jgi:integrase/recombinase XerD
MADPFPDLLQRFFADYLPKQRGFSAHTISAYRDTFRLLLPFLSTRLRKPIDQLTLEALSPETILSFLDHLEQVRQNKPRTRNHRLAAIRSFTRFALNHTALDFLGAAQRILTIPEKRCPKPLLGFLAREEIDAILAAMDDSTWSGRRDHLLFTLLYNTGARISEALQARFSDIQDRAIRLHGKGRKERVVPLWAQTARRIKQWCQVNALRPDQLLFANQRGAPLSRQGASFRLAVAVRKAALNCPALKDRKISPHSIRHSTAMALLQAGVSLEVIALYLGHEQPSTTHGYIEADLKMKTDSLRRLVETPTPKRQRPEPPSRVLAFLEAL